MNISNQFSSKFIYDSTFIIKDKFLISMQNLQKRTALVALLAFSLMAVFCYYHCKLKKEKVKLPNTSPSANSEEARPLTRNPAKILDTKIENPVKPQAAREARDKTIAPLVPLPVVERELKEGFFVDVLNSGGYSINGKNVIIPPAQKPIKFARAKDKNFEESLNHFKKEYAINDQNKLQFQFKDLTTEQAINESSSLRIALNFANEEHAGGGPGFHKDKESGLFVYDDSSAPAQEESLCQRSDLMASLTQLPHTLKADSPDSKFIRSYYDEKFDSREMAYGSLNHLFGVQINANIYETQFLEQPKPVVFVTSAAKHHGFGTINCKKGSKVYLDAKQRIETHLLAAALYSKEILKQDASNPQPVELILGAFGCGAFAPKGNSNEYRKMIADIYLELLPQFNGIFDVVTFAIPTFGETNPSNANVANHNIFKEKLSVLKTNEKEVGCPVQ